MARPLRIEYPGAQYHVTSRGIDRREIFRNDNDCAYFIRRLKESADLFKVEVIAYCLMSNHFHFLLITKEANLSRFMQRLNVTYTRYFNDTYKRVGTLMQGRYKAILVGSNDYFLTLSRYIHLNPIKIKNIRRQNQSKQKICECGHKKFGEHRFSFYEKKKDLKRVAQECNVKGCKCKKFKLRKLEVK